MDNLKRSSALPQPANRPIPAQRLRAAFEDRRTIYELQRIRANDNTPSARAVVRTLARVGFALVATGLAVIAVLVAR